MNTLKFSPFPVLSTGRILLRQLQPIDAQGIFDLRKDEAVNVLIGRKKAEAIDEACTFIENRNRDIAANNTMYWAVCQLDKPDLIGTYCLFHFCDDNTIAEIGYEFLPAYRGQGFAKEAMEKVIEYCFNTLQLKMLVAYVHRENEISLRLLQKFGFAVNTERRDEHNANNLILELKPN